MDEEETPEPLVSDEYIARLVDKSSSWVRQERYRRRHGMHHVLTIDWIDVGPTPRYRRKDVNDWFRKVSKPQEVCPVVEELP